MHSKRKKYKPFFLNMPNTCSFTINTMKKSIDKQNDKLFPKILDISSNFVYLSHQNL